jgi:hypothetical protein
VADLGDVAFNPFDIVSALGAIEFLRTQLSR